MDLTLIEVKGLWGGILHFVQNDDNNSFKKNQISYH